jgi:hypothetical protein
MIDSPQRWDYRIELALPIEKLRELGADGWELAGVNERDRTKFIFRRPVQSFVERVTLEQRARYYESLGLDPETGR